MRDELLPLEELAKTWNFTYDIIFVLRVLPASHGRKTFRLFDSRDNSLRLDISIIYEQYQLKSRNEQLEALCIYLYKYMSESVAKYKKYADMETQNRFLAKVKIG